jgi:predicted nucleic acid-binding protein
VPLFCDSSALVKYYVTEPGSAWVRQMLDAEPLILLAEITIVEVSAALGIIQRQGRIRAADRREFWERFERDIVDRYDLVPVVLDTVYIAAMFCASHPLRAYDAVQMAVAMTLRDKLADQDMPLTFVSADAALEAAAAAEGLVVENPFWHTDLDPS